MKKKWFALIPIIIVILLMCIGFHWLSNESKGANTYSFVASLDKFLFINSKSDSDSAPEIQTIIKSLDSTWKKLDKSQLDLIAQANANADHAYKASNRDILFVDAWGRDIIIIARLDENDWPQFAIYSAAIDGKFDTPDDIMSMNATPEILKSIFQAEK